MEKVFNLGPFRVNIHKNQMAPFISFIVWRGDKHFIECIEGSFFHWVVQLTRSKETKTRGDWD